MLLTIDTAKNVKGEKKGYLTGVLFLSPHKESGVVNTCPYADGCEKVCLNTAGRLRFDGAMKARLERTYWFQCDRVGFIKQLDKEITQLERKAQKKGMKAAVRLNGLSDLRWNTLAPELFTQHPDVQFYDYTKSLSRYQDWLEARNEGRWTWPKNYHLTFSAGRTTSETTIDSLLLDGGTVAIVYHKVPMARSHHSAPDIEFDVIDGDANDLRFLDPESVIVGLKAKGAAKKNGGDFVRE